MANVARDGFVKAGMIHTLTHELRLALRALRRSLGFSATTFLTLALGIGATSAMFSVFNAVLLQPLPWGQPDRAVMIWSRWNAFDKTWVADGEVLDYRRRMTTVSSVAAWDAGEINVTGAGEPERAGAAAVSANLFDTLAAPLELGRPFSAIEDAPGGPRVAIVSHDLWQRRFGGDPGILGRGIQLNGRGYAIAGVTARGFSLPTDYAASERTQVFTPLQIDPRTAEHGSHGLYAAARLKRGASVAQATAELESIARAMTREGLYPEAMQFRAFAVSLVDEVVGNVRPAVAAVFGAVAFLLLIACANVANLMLVRAEARQRDIAVRTALGASPGRIVCQLVIEALALSLAAGLAGLLVSAALLRWIAWWNPAGIPRLSDASVDLRVAAFTLITVVVVAVLFSAAPAFRVYRGDFSASLKDGNQNATVGRHQRFRAALIVAETALAVVLLVGAGLMLQSLVRLEKIPLGLDPSNVLTAHVVLPEAGYPSGESAVQFYRRLVARARSIPGVTSAAVVRSLPLASEIGDFGLTIEGYVPPPGHHAKGDWQVASDGYLETLGERLLGGRSFRPSDDENAMLVALVNEQMAKKYWPGQDPIGRRFRIGSGMSERPWVTVVGIVGDVRHNGITAAIKEKFYIPHAQWHRSVGPMRGMYLVVRGVDRHVEGLVPSIRAAVGELDPNVPVASVRSMSEVVDAALSRPRFTGMLFTIFSALALLLAALGIYGVLSYIVTERTREIGIRMAIGATAGAISRDVIARGVVLAGLGVAAGGVSALALGRAISTLLYGVTPADPATFAATAAVLLVVAAVASLIPARRATRVDPIIALRAE